MKENKSIDMNPIQDDCFKNAKEVVRAFVIENFMFGEGEGLEDSTSFQDSGVIDSTGILELVNFLEERFVITIADEELVPENLESIHNVALFLGSKFRSVGLAP